MITVHHLENSRSQRVLWLLEELALPYQLVRYARDPQTLLAPAALRAVHPLGKSPVLVDDGHTLTESGAVLEYLVERYDTSHALSPTPLPVDSPERLNYRYWMHYAEGSAMPPLLLSTGVCADPRGEEAVLRPPDRRWHRRPRDGRLRRSAAEAAPGLDGTVACPRHRLVCR